MHEAYLNKYSCIESWTIAVQTGGDYVQLHDDGGRVSELGIYFLLGRVFVMPTWRLHD